MAGPTDGRNAIDRMLVSFALGNRSIPKQSPSRARSIPGDFYAASVGALTALPQTVAYGLIAFLPLGPDWAVFGISAGVGTSILFAMITGTFSSNPFLLSGPRAVTALVLATAIQAGLERGFAPITAIGMGFAGVAVAGLFQIAAGTLRLGHLVSFVPVPVLVGFVNASALLVFLSSLPMLVGLPGESVLDIARGAAGPISAWALGVGGVTVLFNFVLENRLKLVPAALAALAIGTGLYYLGTSIFALETGPVVGPVDLSMLVQMSLPFEADLSWALLWRDADIPLLAGLSIGLLTSFDTVLTASALDRRTETTSNLNRDLKVHGLANAAMGLLGFLPGSGAIGRSNAVIKAGATSRYANAGTGIVFAIMLSALAPVVAALPLWATAGMLMATAVQAFDRPSLDKAWQLLTGAVAYPRVLAGDVFVTLAVVATAVAFNLIMAVGVGIVLAGVLFVLGMGREPVRRTYTGAKVRSNVLRPAHQIDCLEREGHRIAIIEIQGALFFGACARLQARAKSLLDAGAEYLILDFRHLTSIDSTGAAALRTLHAMCADAGGKLILSCIEPERRNARSAPRAQIDPEISQRRRDKARPRWIWVSLEVNDIVSTIGTDWIFDDTESAIAICEDLLLERLGKTARAVSREGIAGSGLFEGLSRRQIAQLGKFAMRHRFDPGEVVFRQGETGERAYFLVGGQMDVLIDIPGSSRKHRVSVFSAHTLFGEMALIDGSPRSATVSAARRSVCVSIDADTFKILQDQKSELALVLMRNLSRQLAGRLRIANNMIAELGH